MAVHLYLYATSHCHLCEQAESLLSALATDFDIHWTSIEIADDSTLLALYEVKIPVLRRLDNNHEILWPFTLSDIVHFIN
ncbi:MAG: glutaredoxin family protein [Methylotenera sp.]|nr:glutaredoxin family protein [Methylotenera sp.]MSP99930.1 glutaredoxin family protein [Methylotenera sp.]